MADVRSDQYWEKEFDITNKDLDRIAKWIGEKQTALTLTELTQRLVRGRLEHGEDTSTIALPGWIQEQKVLSWDAEDHWEIGTRVLVARAIRIGVIKPIIGQVIDANADTFLIKTDGGENILKYARARTAQEAQRRFEAIRNAVTAKERTAQQKLLRREADEYVEVILLKHGARVASRLLTSLTDDSRFVSVGDRWFLGDLLLLLSQNQLNKLHQKMLADGLPLTLGEMLLLLDPPLPSNDIGLFSLHKALHGDPRSLFEESNLETPPKWKAIKPPPPPWDQATATCYVYDPSTYEVILQPGQPLKKHIAERLQELKMYDKVVAIRAS